MILKISKKLPNNEQVPYCGIWAIWLVGYWTPKLPTTTQGLSCIVHICHTYILQKKKNKTKKQCLMTYLLKIDLLGNWTPKLPTTSQVICKITLHTYIPYTITKIIKT